MFHSTDFFVDILWTNKFVLKIASVESVRIKFSMGRSILGSNNFLNPQE